MTNPRASRLHPSDKEALEPFVRAEHVKDCSIYWMAVSRFPVDHMQRRWLLQFHERLAKHLKEHHGLREEVLLHFKALYPDLVDHFIDTSMAFVPMAGASVTPGRPLPEKINLDGLKAQVDEAKKNGGLIDVQKWMPDYLYWFTSKKPVEQRLSFYGLGGMMTLYLPPDPALKGMVVEIPRFVRTSPAFLNSRGDMMDAEIARAASMRDAFLAKSKEVFGEPLRSDPSYKGLLFVLPFLTAEYLLKVQPEERQQWFTVFDGYIVESKEDSGILFLINQVDFDDELAQIVREMKEDGYVCSN